MGNAGDEGTEADPSGVGGQRPEQRPGFETGTVPIAIERTEMVEGPGPLESRFLCHSHPAQNLFKAELMLGNVETEFHRPSLGNRFLRQGGP